VVRGVLAGLEGTLIRCGEQSKLVISVEMIQRSVSVSVAGSDVKPAYRRSNISFPLSTISLGRRPSPAELYQQS
jgi:hypothetical protein